ncbi:MAG: hypothetical protein ABSG55_03200 [Dehalococcoidia bacterium]|jgi:hypothetical protein
MAVRTWVGQFGVVRGQAQQAGPWQGKFSLQPSNEEPVDLYVLAQPALPGSEEFCGQLVAVVGHLFERENLSITGALTKAIAAAHENLRDWNRRSLREHQVGAGLSCLVVRGTVAYLAQAGPSLAYFRRGDSVRRLVAEDPPAAVALGLADDLRPQLRRYDLAPGDLLIVASPALTDVVDEDHIRSLLALDAEEALSELYLLTRDQPDFSVFLLSCFEGEDAEAAGEGPAGLPAEAAPPVAVPPAPHAAPSYLRREPEPYEEDNNFRLLSPLELAPVAVTAPLPGRQTVRLRGSQPGMRHNGPAPVSRLTKRFPVWLLPAALLVFIIGLLAWWVMPSSIQGTRDQKFDTLVSTARNDYNASVSASDPTEKRRLLNEASSSLAGAASIRADDVGLLSLKSEVVAAVATMNGIQELADLRPVADLKTQLTGDLALQQLVVGGGQAYLLDVKKNRVVSVSLTAPEGQAKEVFNEGDLVGMIKAAKPVQITWLPDPNGGSLLVLDSDNHLFSLSPGAEPRPLSLGGDGEWRSLDSLSAGDDGLYVLDKQSGQVWHYPAGEDGTAQDPKAALEGSDFSSAVGLAVNGDIYVLDENGIIHRFSAGQEVAFDLAGLDRPLTSAASLLPLSDGGLLVVDRGNKRIVVFGGDGRFQRQFVSNQLTDPQAVAVDEVTARLYILNGDSLFVAGLPSTTGPQDANP